MLSSNPRVRDHEQRRDGAALPGELFAERYEAVSELGRGSIGQLYLAREIASGARVVVKHATDPSLVRHEADVLAALEHPNVVRLKERHDASSPPFLVLEPVEGTDLEAFLSARGGTLDEVTLGRLLLQLADTTAFLHARGLLHRDLKPANILLRGDGSPVLVDFGAALPLDQAGSARLWSFVTEGYAAPEQYFADQGEGPWTDVYGLGAIGYRALAGHAPSPALIRAGGALGEPLATSGNSASALRRAIDWALEPDAADRPQTMAQWRDSVAAALKEAEETALPASDRRDPALDDYPPTIRVERVARHEAARKTVAQGLDTAALPPRRSARLLPIALTLAVLAAGLVAAGLYAWPLYERYIKTEWLVDPSGAGDATTIADALARAGDGATIRVAPGTYQESLRIERPVNLIALESGAAPIIAPESGPCLLVTSRDGAIVGLDLRGAAVGDPATAAPACVILAGGGVSLEGNRISAASGPGLLIDDGANPVVRGNRLEGAGMVVTAGARGTIAENRIVDAAGPSLIVRGGADPSLSDNVIEGGAGVVFAEGALGSFVGNRLLATNATGIRATTGANPRVIDNTIEQAKEAGIFVYDWGAGRFEGNTIVGSGLSGVAIAGGGLPAFVSNTIRDNAEHGILVVEGGRALLQGNQIMANQGHGIALGADSEVELIDNRLEGNDEPQLLDAR
jgi:parallel beta-helix repeat protein